MNLLYFVECDNPNKPIGGTFLADHGIAYAFDSNDDLQPSPVKTGPSGKPGFIISRKGTERVNQYAPELQRWQAIPGTTSFVGLWTDEPGPSPEQLEREQTLFGEDLRLSDGNRWTIPLVRLPIKPHEDGNSQITLPHAMTLDAAGNWVKGEIVPRNLWLLELLTPYWDSWNAAFMRAVESKGKADDQAFETGNVWSIAAKVLSANYHVSAAECALLGLFATTKHEGRLIIEFALGIPVAEEWWDNKKKERERSGSASNAGNAA